MINKNNRNLLEIEKESSIHTNFLDDCRYSNIQEDEAENYVETINLKDKISSRLMGASAILSATGLVSGIGSALYSTVQDPTPEFLNYAPGIGLIGGALCLATSLLLNKSNRNVIDNISKQADLNRRIIRNSSNQGNSDRPELDTL